MPILTSLKVMFFPIHASSLNGKEVSGNPSLIIHGTVRSCEQGSSSQPDVNSMSMCVYHRLSERTHTILSSFFLFPSTVCHLRIGAVRPSIAGGGGIHIVLNGHRHEPKVRVGNVPGAMRKERARAVAVGGRRRRSDAAK